MADETEQQLREKIASQKTTIANLPSLRSIVDETGLTSPETKARAKLIKELSDNEEQLKLLLESKRIAAVIRLQDELHPPENSEDCPICLETIKHVNCVTMTRFYCCGGLVCKQCGDERNKDMEEGLGDKLRGKCPLCREKMPDANALKKITTIISKHANKGRAWAQADVGAWVLRGLHGFASDKDKGLQLLKQAADQRNPDALLKLAVAYKGETLERDESKCMFYLKEAADLGHEVAQRMLGVSYKERSNENKEHLHYTTLAASQGDYKACGLLAHYFLYPECGVAKSLILVKHYSEKSLEYDEKEGEAIFAYILSCALFQLGKDRYEGVLEIPGHSPIPKALFWARRALQGDSTVTTKDSATELLSVVENEAMSHCAYCRKEEGCASLKRCVRCLGAWYCGKECQVQHWKAGHKIDCTERHQLIQRQR